MASKLKPLRRVSMCVIVALTHARLTRGRNALDDDPASTIEQRLVVAFTDAVAFHNMC